MPDRQALQGSGPILVNILEIVKILANRFIEGVTFNEHTVDSGYQAHIRYQAHARFLAQSRKNPC